MAHKEREMCNQHRASLCVVLTEISNTKHYNEKQLIALIILVMIRTSIEGMFTCIAYTYQTKFQALRQ